MIIVLESGTNEAQKTEILAELEKRGLRGRVLEGPVRPVIHVIEGSTRQARKLLGLERVEALVATSGPRIRREGRRFYPYHFIGWCAAGLILLGILVTLAGFLPPGLGAELDPRAPRPDLVAPWFLCAPVALLRFLPGMLGWVVLAAAFVLLLCVPLLDRAREAAPRPSALRVAIVVAVVAGWLLLTLTEIG